MIRAIASFVVVGLPVFAASSILLKGIFNLKGTDSFLQLLDAFTFFRRCFSCRFFLFLGSFFLDKIGGHPFVLRVHRSHPHGIDASN